MTKPATDEKSALVTSTQTYLYGARRQAEVELPDLANLEPQRTQVLIFDAGWGTVEIPVDSDPHDKATKKRSASCLIL